jgi:hypothetical protein
MTDPDYPPPSDDNIPPPPPVDAPLPPPRRRIVPVAVGALGGVLAGVLIAWAISASATAGNGHTDAQQAGPSTPAGSAPTGRLPSGYPSNVRGGYDDHDGRLGDHRGPGGYGLPGATGTVTAVGSDSVTIKSPSGTKTYPVTSASDIDKYGEATLADLKSGDKVWFDTTTVNGKTIINHLHAGNEALDRPPGGR